jgi:hypothetical protein
VPLDIAHAELDVVVGVLVATQALPVPVDEVMRHREKRRGFIEAEGPVGLWGVMIAGPGSRQQTDECLERVRQFGFWVRPCSGLFGSHIE